MLAVMSLSQHRVSSSKTVRPRAPCGARCIGHSVSTWSAVCSEAPHSQFDKKVRHTFASKVASLFRELSDFTEDIETKWDLFKSTVITVAIRSNKVAFRAWLTNKSSEQLRIRYSSARNNPAIIVKQSKEKSWEEWGQKLDKD